MLRSILAFLAVSLASASFGELKVSSLGFDANDSTRFLQAALDSGESRIVVDRQTGPWVTGPLFGRRSNMEIVFEQGVELVAKKGEFRGRNDCLVKFIAVSNVTVKGYGAVWRMHRADYDAAPYSKGEWRHSLSMLGCINITVEGLTLLESGGDGVYIANGNGNGKPCRNVVLRDLVCDRQYRQGISVITVDGLLIERCRMINTAGTPPAAGIDFEPNAAFEELANIVMRDCELGNNAGSGIEFYLGQLDATSRPVSARIYNCRSYNNKRGFSFGFGNKPTFTSGEVMISGCSFEHERDTGVYLHRKPKEAVGLVFEKCSFKKCAGDVELMNKFIGDRPVDGFVFNDCIFDEPGRKPRISRMSKAPEVEGLPSIVKFDSAAAHPFDDEPGQKTRLAAIRLRHNVRYRFYVAAPGKVEFSARAVKLGKSRPLNRPIRFRDASGKALATVPYPQGDAEKAFTFDAPAVGFYLMEIDAGGHAFQLTESSAPVALEVDGAPQNVLASTARIWFRVGGDTAAVLAFSGSDKVEKVHAVVRNPAGAVVFDKDNIIEWEICRAEASGLWSVDLKRPSQGHFEDNSICIFGAQPEFFLTEKKGW